jgi:hypothetical protein
MDIILSPKISPELLELFLFFFTNFKTTDLNNHKTALMPSFRKMTFTEHEFNRDSSVFRGLISQRAVSFLRSFAPKCGSLLPYQKKIVGKRAAICGDRHGFMKFGYLSVGGMLRTVRLRFGLRLEVCGTKVSIKGNCFGLHVKRLE